MVRIHFLLLSIEQTLHLSLEEEGGDCADFSNRCFGYLNCEQYYPVSYDFLQKKFVLVEQVLNL